MQFSEKKLYRNLPVPTVPAVPSARNSLYINRLQLGTAASPRKFSRPFSTGFLSLANANQCFLRSLSENGRRDSSRDSRDRKGQEEKWLAVPSQTTVSKRVNIVWGRQGQENPYNLFFSRRGKEKRAFCRHLSGRPGRPQATARGEWRRVERAAQ